MVSVGAAWLGAMAVVSKAAHSRGQQDGATVSGAHQCLSGGGGISGDCFLGVWWLGSKNEHSEMQKVEAVTFLRCEPRNWYHILLVKQLIMWILNRQFPVDFWKYFIWISFNQMHNTKVAPALGKVALFLPRSQGRCQVHEAQLMLIRRFVLLLPFRWMEHQGQRTGSQLELLGGMRRAHLLGLGWGSWQASFFLYGPGIISLVNT